LKGRGYKYDTLYLPHDADKGEAATGVTFTEVMRSMGFRVEVLKRIEIEDGINAARMLFPKCVFDEDRTQAGLQALQNYRWGYNPRMDELKMEPVHDWASHGADAFRYLALSVRVGIADRPALKPLVYPKKAYV
jgi:phage terminase large subunit